MPFGINNPLPSSMRSECKKAGKILASFVDPRQSFGPDKVIPPSILANAKGLAVLTVFKAGFLGSGRLGSGVVVARLADGSWSAPSAIATAGGGFGGQIGFELTDFVFILNDYNAVRSFSQAASVTLGGNVSIAAGPVGRNAEAAGAASLKGVAGVFSYSKTKGLFAGVSLEGSVLIERRDANEKLYNGRVTARQLLEGAVRPPPAADPLMRVLNTRVFSGAAFADNMYNDMPIYDDQHDDVVWEGRTGEAYGANVRNNRSSTVTSADDNYVYRDNPSQARRANTWNDDIYDRAPAGRTNTGNNSNSHFDTFSSRSRSSTLQNDHSYSDNRPNRPTAPKPIFKQKTGMLRSDQAVALFTFDPDQEGDLGFKKGDVITITKRTESKSDWWTGRTEDGRTGVFPSNYVETAS
ncbi:SH3 domain-containing protein [Cladophialophora carrionii]|uniref:SH3 domain-containing protein n=1 Tax=Cladophialophora carrionii TaxID=86049 RepID=A0A1C1CD73_9EURO|nr:SH3 domain-containing protein [Cladophialophora carrionii]